MEPNGLGKLFPTSGEAGGDTEKQWWKALVGCVPTISDRIAQMVVKRFLEPDLDAHFDPDSYGYRPGKSAHDAVGQARERCWRRAWVLDLDIKAFFDSIDHA